MKKEKRKLKRFFVAPKGEKVSYKSLIRVTLSSIIGVLLCGFFLAGLSWAWVTDGVTSAKNIIKPVNYDIIVNITDGNGEEVLAESGKSYLLSAGQRYTVVLTATGEASTGYCKVTLNGYIKTESLFLCNSAKLLTRKSLTCIPVSYTHLDVYKREVLLISSGDIKLEGYDYGLIGGASGKISDNTVVFFGNAEMHPCYLSLIHI